MKKKVYQVTLVGFNGGSDETDHLIKWVIAYTKKAVKKAFPDYEKVERLDIDLFLDDPSIDFDLTKEKE